MEELLRRLAPGDKLANMLTVYNKCDLVIGDGDENKSSDESRVEISCTSMKGVDKLRELIEKRVYKQLGFIEMTLKLRQGSPEFSHVYKVSTVKRVEEDGESSEFVLVRVVFSKVNALKFIKLYPHVKVFNRKKN